MKIRPEHYAHMRDAIAALPVLTTAAIRTNAANDRRVKNLEKRIRWDLHYAAGLTRYVCDNIYPYADDTHIDTALRAIVKELAL